MNPAAAAHWLNENTDDPSYDRAFIGFVSGYGERDLESATKAVLNTLQPQDPLMESALMALGSFASARGSSDAVRGWFGDLLSHAGNQPQLGSEATFAAAYHMVGQSMPETAAFVREQSGEPWRSNKAIGYVAWRYSQVDPAATAAWIETLPATPGTNGREHIGVSEVV